MAIYFISDLHVYHKNIIEYSNRPFINVEEMNETIIKNWNSVVMPEDEVYNLGDVSFGTADQTESILQRLVGKHYLIKGNHDDVKNTLSQKCIKYFEWIKDYYELMIEDQDTSSGKRRLIMCHYPLLTWNGAHKIDKKGQYRSLSFHGHCHSSIDYLNEKTTRIDVGIDNPKAKYTPMSFEQIKNIMKDRKYEILDHHGKPDKYNIK